MKKISILLSSILLFVACSKEVDKKQELAELKTQAQEIQLKIKAWYNLKIESGLYVKSKFVNIN